MRLTLADRWDRWKRRRYGSFHIEDPRPIAEGAPYTFFLPSENELLALAPGDLAKLTFVGEPGGKTYEAERMWVTVTQTSPVDIVGKLENLPTELHQLQPGELVSFQRHHVIDILWADDRKQKPPPAAPHREFWERCLVDRCVLDEGVPVYYLYREEPDLAAPEDKYPDSGWRIRGDYRGLTDEELATWEQGYIAVGKVLNADDSWLHLIDAAIGSAFIRDEVTGAFLPSDRQLDED